jgi:hypothetical protein
MGLDTTHGAWHGAYSAFHRWRCMLAEAAGMPPLDLMEGFYASEGYRNPFLLLESKFPNGEELEMIDLRRFKKQFPIKWSALKPSPLHKLLYHSDCEGYLNWRDCGKIADALEALLPNVPEGEGGGHIGDWKQKTQTFIDGCRLAHSQKEKLQFH